MKKVAIIGASGYVGAELAGLLAQHSQVSIEHLVISENSTSYGKHFADLHARWQGVIDVPLFTFSAQWFEQYGSQLDAVFFATPHEFSAQWAAKFVEAGVKVFDLSGGFRLKSCDQYPQYYGFEHQFPEYVKQAVYGLAEFNEQTISQASLIAVPGCYPTASLLAIKPLADSQLIDESQLIVVNGISGVSGAGRNANLATSFNEVSLKPYNILQHRHQPEISQEAGCQVIFNPHLAPFKRGLLSTVTLSVQSGVSSQDVQQAYLTAYQDKPLIRLKQSWPQIDHVAHTPFADIYCQVDEQKQVAVVSCAIDNLLKGAAAQAVQCFNLSYGWASHLHLLPKTISLGAA
ncbi:N-acetyl-gamma-glutamyl-phosphate reductase [Thalassotalea sp. LPB0316]|uniref:N-acetyl-gamma-glutamyl-phosphate reductase n=1 Tax=Thalassotalea sp. LPB0316 TaxID=2769490 RepID=UPI0018683A46|nr:N-acetyl-gamma-glutamyl-phosphate reductase [Thalassotalea sp. LPB0316]QOL26545.1 N-acetyl-gamma-glutamyl-phosphate reductase [Thalassotalea sp. LPB0316]